MTPLVNLRPSNPDPQHWTYLSNERSPSEIYLNRSNKFSHKFTGGSLRWEGGCSLLLRDCCRRGLHNLLLSHSLRSSLLLSHLLLNGSLLRSRSSLLLPSLGLLLLSLLGLLGGGLLGGLLPQEAEALLEGELLAEIGRLSVLLLIRRLALRLLRRKRKTI